MVKIKSRENEESVSVIRRFQKCKCCFFKKVQFKKKRFFIKPSKIRDFKF